MKRSQILKIKRRSVIVRQFAGFIVRSFIELLFLHEFLAVTIDEFLRCIKRRPMRFVAAFN